MKNWGLVPALILSLVLCPVLALADATAFIMPPVITVTGTISHPAQSQAVPMIPGMNICTITLSGANSFQAVAQSYNGSTWDFYPSFGSSGFMSSAAAYSGAVDPTKMTKLAFSVTTISPGQILAYEIQCGYNSLPTPIPMVLLPFRVGQITSVAADGSATFTATYDTAFASTFGPITLTPSTYSGSDNAIVSCRITSDSLTGFSGICGGGQSASTITLFYSANGT